MNYLGRPVFDTPPNWRELPRKRFDFDLKAQSIGFNEEYFASLQQWVVQGWEILLDLNSQEKINAFESFTAALTGRLGGFWLPSPIDAFKISAAVSTSQFDVIGQKLSDSLDTRADRYLYFIQEGLAPAAAKILNVVDNGDGTERVTIDANLDEDLFAPETICSRLLYVALASDEEQAEVVAEGWLAQKLRVVELPTEYAAFETGTKKIVLYHFWCESPMNYHWRFTSFAADVISQNNTFTKFPISHSTLTRGVKLEGETLEIAAKYDAAHPLALFLPIPFSRPMFVEVSETTFGDPDTATVIFTGRIISVPDAGEKLTARCESFAYYLRKKIPAVLIGPGCSYDVFGRNCKAARVQFETSAIITDIDNTARPPVCKVSLNFPGSPNFTNWTSLDWFAQGFIETGAVLNLELRVVLSSSYDGGTHKLTLKLNAPLLKAAVGNVVQLIPGCDGAFLTCKNKFFNEANFGGFPQIPKNNPSLTALDMPVAKGGKGK